MPLSPLYVLVGVVAARSATLLSSLYALEVHDGCGGIGVFTVLFPLGRAQDHENTMPQPAQAESAKVVENRPPRREVTGQHPPGTAAPQDVEDRVEDVPQGMSA